MAAFREFVREECGVTINMRPYPLFTVLAELGPYEPLAKVVAERAEASGRSPAEELRSALGPAYEARQGFVATFEGARDFKYGSLNPGVLGPHTYGAFSVLLSEAWLSDAASCRVCYVKNDSAGFNPRYVEANGTVDLQLLQPDLADTPSRHLLALLKHSHEVQSARDQWPKIVCNRSCYIEAIILGEVDIGAIAEVRASETTKKFIAELLARRLAEVELTDDEWIVFDVYTAIQRLVKRHFGEIATIRP